MAAISDSLRQSVTERADGFCEYCQAEAGIIVFMDIDHIRPESDNGPTIEANLCLSCPGCNNSKGAHQTGLDPDTKQEVALFNPRTQAWREHFRWSNNYTLIEGITPVGRATLNRLNMNRDLMVAARTRWRRAGWQPPG
jgi:hypothetical protein